MDATEFCALTEQAVAELLAGRGTQPSDVAPQQERRATPRWPFPGTVEFWVKGDEGIEEHRLATCLNLGWQGVGVTADFPLELGLEVALAIHQPEVSLHGRACVRHCAEVEIGYYIGLQFIFDAE